MAANTPKVADNMVVTFEYKLFADGELFLEEGQDGEYAEAYYLHGAGMILPGLEEALAGKSVGDQLTVSLAAEDAYGEYDETAIESLDRADIPDADQLEAGMEIELEDDEGFIDVAFVKEVTPDVIILDFNEPLAGKALKYEIRVTGVRPANEDEIAHGHPHGEYGDEYEDEDEE